MPWKLKYFTCELRSGWEKQDYVWLIAYNYLLYFMYLLFSIQITSRFRHVQLNSPNFTKVDVIANVSLNVLINYVVELIHYESKGQSSILRIAWIRGWAEIALE